MSPTHREGLRHTITCKLCRRNIFKSWGACLRLRAPRRRVLERSAYCLSPDDVLIVRFPDPRVWKTEPERAQGEFLTHRVHGWRVTPDEYLMQVLEGTEIAPESVHEAGPEVYGSEPIPNRVARNIRFTRPHFGWSKPVPGRMTVDYTAMGVLKPNEVYSEDDLKSSEYQESDFEYSEMHLEGYLRSDEEFGETCLGSDMEPIRVYLEDDVGARDLYPMPGDYPSSITSS